MFHKNNQQFNVLGKKYTGKFEEYPIIIPKAIEDFRESYRGDDSFTRVIVYEPKKSPEHTVEEHLWKENQREKYRRR